MAVQKNALFGGPCFPEGVHVFASLRERGLFHNEMFLLINIEVPIRLLFYKCGRKVKEDPPCYFVNMSDGDPYESTGGGLRLKGKADKLVKKKRKDKGKCKEIVDLATQADPSKQEKKKNDGSEGDHKTAAEKAFERVQEKRGAERVLKKASKSHKQRVEELNEYLGNLSEHYDIQKVSWTK